jgi:hypothetical protein
VLPKRLFAAERLITQEAFDSHDDGSLANGAQRKELCCTYIKFVVDAGSQHVNSFLDVDGRYVV